MPSGRRAVFPRLLRRLLPPDRRSSNGSRGCRRLRQRPWRRLFGLGTHWLQSSRSPSPAGTHCTPLPVFSNSSPTLPPALLSRSERSSAGGGRSAEQRCGGSSRRDPRRRHQSPASRLCRPRARIRRALRASGVGAARPRTCTHVARKRSGCWVLVCHGRAAPHLDVAAKEDGLASRKARAVQWHELLRPRISSMFAPPHLGTCTNSALKKRR